LGRNPDELGAALGRLGERDSGTARLEEAVAAYREALQENTRVRVPLEWAMTQMNLGNALTRLGERETGTARLEEAVAAFREALKERTRARAPLEWAMVQTISALPSSFSERGKEERHGLKRPSPPFAKPCRKGHENVCLSIGHDTKQPRTALVTLGERESGTARLEEAVAAYREACRKIPVNACRSIGP